MSQVTNLAYFYETARKVRGGKWVWVKDSNGENRKNVLLGGTILNPNKGFGHLWAAQLVQYTPGEGCKIFRSFKVISFLGDGKFRITADGYSDVPEVGMLLMVAPNNASATGQSGKVTSVNYVNDGTNEPYWQVITDSEDLNPVSGAILVEAEGTAASATAKVLVPNPNTFVEADVDLLPTEGYGIENANYSISTVHDKEAWIARMQPLPDYVLAKNRSYIDGIFWI